MAYLTHVSSHLDPSHKPLTLAGGEYWPVFFFVQPEDGRDEYYLCLAQKNKISTYSRKQILSHRKLTPIHTQVKMGTDSAIYRDKNLRIYYRNKNGHMKYVSPEKNFFRRLLDQVSYFFEVKRGFIPWVEVLRAPKVLLK